MKGLSRIRPRRRDTEPAPQDAQQTVAVAPVPLEPAVPLPAGASPTDSALPRPSFRDRGRLRRRLRFLRRVRELGFRDLGGLVFDLHRYGRQADELVRGKLLALEAVDRELRALERVLDERQDVVELREPGIAACPRCGALHGSDDRFCSHCGVQFGGALAFGEVSTPVPAPAVPLPGPAGLHAAVPPEHRSLYADPQGARPAAIGPLTATGEPAQPAAAGPMTAAGEHARPAASTPPGGSDSPTIAGREPGVGVPQDPDAPIDPATGQPRRRPSNGADQDTTAFPPLEPEEPPTLLPRDPARGRPR